MNTTGEERGNEWMVFGLKTNKGRGQRWSTRISLNLSFKTCTPMQLPKPQTNHMNRPLIILSVYASINSQVSTLQHSNYFPVKLQTDPQLLEHGVAVA